MGRYVEPAGAVAGGAFSRAWRSGEPGLPHGELAVGGQTTITITAGTPQLLALDLDDLRVIGH